MPERTAGLDLAHNQSRPLSRDNVDLAELTTLVSIDDSVTDLGQMLTGERLTHDSERILGLHGTSCAHHRIACAHAKECGFSLWTKMNRRGTVDQSGCDTVLVTAL